MMKKGVLQYNCCNTFFNIHKTGVLMNSFETDLKRAVISWRFAAGILIQLTILLTVGMDDKLFYISVPIVCTFPYTTAWLSDYQGGYIKFYIIRSGVKSYIFGKISACGISGGLLEVTACKLYFIMADKEKIQNISCDYRLIFISGVLWAVFAAALAAISNSSYVAYGGSFIIYYMLVILHDRYFEEMYCLYPYEWIKCEHTWIFGKDGIIFMLSGIIGIIIFVYYDTLRRRMENV